MPKSVFKKSSAKLFLAAALILLGAYFLWYFSPELFFRKQSKPLQESPAVTATTTAAAVAAGASQSQSPIAAPKPSYRYFKVTQSCGPYYEGGVCINVRSGPGTEYDKVAELRNGMVLKIADTVADAKKNRMWYKVDFDKNIRYPERISGGWYVAADLVEAFSDEGDILLPKAAAHGTAASGIVGSSGLSAASTTKRILVDRSEEKLYAYDGDTLFMGQAISLGLDATPTPRGTFTIFKKTPSRYMQGPLPGVSDQVYDLPGVPWNLYFTVDGAVIHGAYWHDKFGQPWSHGCVNLPPDQAEKLYRWADVGIKVTVRD